MSNNSTYKVEKYNDNLKNIFKGVYSDFLSKAYIEYKFEIEPLTYDDFIQSVNDNLIDCLILLEDDIPTAFMVYTKEISDAIELNLIHCIGNEHLNKKRHLLMSKFMEINHELMQKKVVTYPMLGSQDEFTPEITHYGFDLIGLAVLRFEFGNPKSGAIYKAYKPSNLPNNYAVTSWNNKYLVDVSNVLLQSFKETTDALFDPRFTTDKGCEDIMTKITDNIYGRFLPDSCSILLYKNKPVGFCMANITAGKIANIPLIGILKEHRSKGLGEALLYNTVKSLINNHLSHLSEVNVSTETDNYPALKMYRKLGFKEAYYYPQAYRKIKKDQ